MFSTALIGCGYWGSKLKNYIERNPRFHLRYVCDSKSDLDQVWDDKEVSAVVIATPNATRYPIVRSALLHDKNVLTEKPLALKTAECEELKQIALDKKRVLMVDYTWTFSDGLWMARGMMKGEILGIEMAMRHLGRFGGGNVYWLLGSHMLSILDMFIPIANLSFKRHDLVVYNGEVETGIISFDNGQMVMSLNYPEKEMRVIIYGKERTVIFDPLSLRMVKYDRLKWTVGSKLPQRRNEFWLDEGHNLYYVIDHFAQALRGEAESNVDRAITITNIIENLMQEA